MQIPEDWLPVIRNFEDRGMQALLQAPENARGLLCILAADICERLDFSRMVCEPVSFTARDLRRRETDLVLRVPYRDPQGEETADVWVYLLFEHQSAPDVEMPVRLLYGMASLWNRQRQEFDSRDVPVGDRRYLPIVPIIVYTGETPWQIAAPVTSLMDVPAELERFQPQFAVLPLDVKGTPPEELEACGHPFAWILRVIQEEDSPLDRLRAVAVEAMRQVDALADLDPVAFERAFVFLILLLYHRRPPEEADEVVTKMAEVSPAAPREEAVGMAKSYFQEALEEREAQGEVRGELRARHKALLMQLAEKFGTLPEAVVQRVQSLQDMDALDALIRRFVHADSLEAMDLR